jgi:tRNA G26 N,N-dimethylase Trm1
MLRRLAEVPAGLRRITEGAADILVPATDEVFYNPIQEFNRDLRYSSFTLF